MFSSSRSWGEVRSIKHLFYIYLYHQLNLQLFIMRIDRRKLIRIFGVLPILDRYILQITGATYVMYPLPTMWFRQILVFLNKFYEAIVFDMLL